MSWGRSGPGQLDHRLRARRPRLRRRRGLPLRHLDARPRRPRPAHRAALEQDAPHVVGIRGAPPLRLLDPSLMAISSRSAWDGAMSSLLITAAAPRCRRWHPRSRRLHDEDRQSVLADEARQPLGLPGDRPEGARQRVVVTRHAPDEADRQRRHGARGPRRGHRGRQAGRGDRRLVRAGPGREHLVPRRGHDRVRERQAGLQGGLASRPGSDGAQAGRDHARARRGSGMRYRQEYYKGHAEDRARGSSACASAPRSRSASSGGR